MKNRFIKTFNREKATAIVALLSFTAYLPLSMMSAFAIDAGALPVLDNKVNGDVTTSGNTMNVQVFNQKGGSNNGVVGQFDWKTFNVGRDARVNWEFTGNNQTALNRVLSTGGMSYIYGQLTNSGTGVDTSKVILINPNGVLFGNGSSVNLNSFTASTKDIMGVKDLSQIIEDSNAINSYIGIKGNNGVLNSVAGYNNTVYFNSETGYIGGNTSNNVLSSIMGSGTSINVNKDLNLITTSGKIDFGTSEFTSKNGNINISSLDKKGNVRLIGTDVTAGNGNINITGKDVLVGLQYYSNETPNSKLTAKGTNKGNITIDSVKTDFVTADIDADNKFDVKATNGIKVTLGTDINAKDVNLEANNSSIGIGDSKITSKNSLNLTAGKDIGIGSDSHLSLANNDINIVSKNKTGNVGVTGSNIIAENGNINLSGKDVLVGLQYYSDKTVNSKLTAKGNNKGNITIESANNTNFVTADIDADNKFDVKATNGINVSLGTDINAKDVNIKSVNGEIGVGVSKITSNGLLNLTAAKNINATNANLISQKGDINIISKDKGGNLGIRGTVINASNGNVNLTGNEAFLGIQYNPGNPTGTTINAKNNVAIEANSMNVIKSSLSAGKKVYMNAVDGISLSQNSNINAADLEMIGQNGGVGFWNSNVNASNVSVSANNDVTVSSSKITGQNSGLFNISSNKNINIKNSNVITNNGNINLTADKVTVKGASNGARANVTALGNNSNGKVTISQTNSMDMVGDFTYANIEAENKLTLKSKNNITGSNFKAGTMQIGNTYDVSTLSNANTLFTLGSKGGTVQTDKNITLTNTNSLKNIELIGENVMVSSQGNMTLTDVKTKSDPTSGETKITTNKDININSLTIEPNSGKTTISGDNVKTVNGTKIEVNGNKLALNGTHDIDVKVSNANNSRKGLEVNADLNTGVQNNNKYSQNVLNGRNVKIDAGNQTLAVSKIKSDTLNLTAGKIVKGDTTISNNLDNLGIVKADGSLEQVVANSNNTKGYIEVKTDGGFTINNAKDGKTYDTNSGKIAYNDNRGAKVLKTEETFDESSKYTQKTGETTTSETYFLTDAYGNPVTTVETTDNGTSSKVVKSETKNVGQPYKEYVYDDNGEAIGYYTHQETETTTVTEITHSYTDNTYRLSETKETTSATYNTYQDKVKTTTKREQQHIATMNGSGETEGFVLVYGKTSTETEPTQSVLVDTKTETSTKITQTGFVDPATKSTTGLLESKNRNEVSTITDITKGRTSTWCDIEPVIPINIPVNKPMSLTSSALGI